MDRDKPAYLSDSTEPTEVVWIGQIGLDGTYHHQISLFGLVDPSRQLGTDLSRPDPSQANKHIKINWAIKALVCAW